MSDFKLRKYIGLVIVLLWAGYLLYLFISGKNAYYINPGYFQFNLLMALILLSAALIGIKNTLILPFTRQQYPLVVGIALAILLVPAPLSSATAGARSLNITTEVFAEQQVSPLLQKNTKELKISDWVNLFNYEPDYSRFADKEVDVSGFIFLPASDDMYSASNFLVGRFVIKCCAVDATPLGLEVSMTSWQDKVKIDDWVRVQGRLKLESRGAETFLVIEPTSVDKISRPANPYE